MVVNSYTTSGAEGKLTIAPNKNMGGIVDCPLTYT